MERQFQWSVPLLDSSAYRTNGFFRMALKGDRRGGTTRDPIRPFASTAIAAAGKVDGLIQQEQR
jgi:hypothetical protein